MKFEKNHQKCYASKIMECYRFYYILLYKNKIQWL